MKRATGRVVVGFVCSADFATEPMQRTLDRVNAQEAIWRVYYSHQIGATKAFEEAVPRSIASWNAGHRERACPSTTWSDPGGGRCGPLIRGGVAAAAVVEID